MFPSRPPLNNHPAVPVRARIHRPWQLRLDHEECSLHEWRRVDGTVTIVPIRVVLCMARTWDRRPDRASPAWEVTRIGPFVLAYRIDARSG
jgi:hypothetical protein